MAKLANNFEEITKSYNSYSGCDIVATCTILGQQYVLGTIQTLSYSLHMDRQPVRSIGNINAKDYTLGPRTIAGSLVFAVFDKHLLYHLVESIPTNANVSSFLFATEIEKYASFTNKRHMLSDEMPPFDITLSLANEYGSRSRLALYGVRLLNEGQVMSINDVMTENTYQFVATDIDYLNTEQNILKYKAEAEEELQNEENNLVIDSIPEDSIALQFNANKSEAQNGYAYFNLYKIVDGENINEIDGMLIIQDNNNPDNILETFISVDSNDKDIFVALSPGYYNAKFIDSENGNETEIIDFTLKYYRDDIFNPIIDTYYTNSSTAYAIIKCYSATKGHDTLCYYNKSEPDKVYQRSIAIDYCVQLVINRDININSEYVFYTINSKNKYIQSKQLEIYTDSKLLDVISNIKEYCTNTVLLSDILNKNKSVKYHISHCIYVNNFANENQYHDLLLEVIKAENTYFRLINSNKYAANDEVGTEAISTLYQGNDLVNHDIKTIDAIFTIFMDDSENYNSLYMLNTINDNTISCNYYKYVDTKEELAVDIQKYYNEKHNEAALEKIYTERLFSSIVNYIGANDEYHKKYMAYLYDISINIAASNKYCNMFTYKPDNTLTYNGVISGENIKIYYYDLNDYSLITHEFTGTPTIQVVFKNNYPYELSENIDNIKLCFLFDELNDKILTYATIVYPTNCTEEQLEILRDIRLFERHIHDFNNNDKIYLGAIV